jgi:uncharacterized membrane protein
MVLVQFLMVLAQFLVVPPRSPSFDSVWLKLVNPFYRGQIGELLADKPHLGYAVVFQVMYFAGLSSLRCGQRSTAAAG